MKSNLIHGACLVGMFAVVSAGTGPGFAQCKLDLLTASDGEGGDNFGLAVATDGDFVIVGAQQHSHHGEIFEGSCYIYQRQGADWIEVQEITASNHDADDNFGQAVAMSGPFAIVGAPGVTHDGALGGAAYIFENVGGNWTERAFLVPSDTADFQGFARSVDIDGDYAVVGAPNDDEGGVGAGAAYIFQRQGNNWMELGKLTASDAHQFDGFGAGVDIEGDRLLIGSGLDQFGSAYIFERSGNSWNERAILTPDEPESRDAFGFYVALGDGVACIGAPSRDTTAEDVGGVFVFTGSGANWTETDLLHPGGDPTGLTSFGCDVAIRGDTLLIGAADFVNRLGLMYIFRHSNGVWTENARVEEFDQTFAQAIDIDTFAVAGAWAGQTACVFDVDLVDEINFEIDPDLSVIDLEIQFPDGEPQLFRVHITGSMQGLVNSDCGTLLTLQVPAFDLRTLEDSFVIELPDQSQATVSDIMIEPVRPGPPAELTFDGDRYSGTLFDYEIEISGSTDTPRPKWTESSVIHCVALLLMGVSPGGGVEGIVFPGIDIETVVDIGFGNMNPTVRITGQIEGRAGSAGVPATLDDFSIITGVLLDGGLPELGASDDAYLHTRSGFGQTLAELHKMEMIVSAVTTVDSPALLDLAIESRIDEPNGSARIRLFNWSTNGFDQVASYSISDTDAVELIEDIDASNYVNNAGEIDLSIKHLVFVPFLAFTFESFIDLNEIVVE